MRKDGDEISDLLIQSEMAFLLAEAVRVLDQRAIEITILFIGVLQYGLLAPMYLSSGEGGSN
jgi:hypothetical protein